MRVRATLYPPSRQALQRNAADLLHPHREFRAIRGKPEAAPSAPRPQYAPFTRIFTPYTFLLAVMKSRCRSFPPNVTFPVQASGIGMFTSFFPVLSKAVTPFPVRYTFPSSSMVIPSEPISQK